MTTEEQKAKEEDETKHPLEHVIERLEECGCEPVPSGEGYVAFCPAHEDRNRPNLSINNGQDGRVVMYCQACGADGSKVAPLLGLEVRDLFPSELRTGSNLNGPQLTLDELADSRGLTVEFLQELGLTESDEGIEIPYFDYDGALVLTRIRTRRNGRDQVRQPKGERLRAYGLDRLADRQVQYLILVEGESDCWTLWSEDFTAVGLPGATAVSTLEDLHLGEISRVFVVEENDHGGAVFVDKVAKGLSDRGYEGEVRIISLPEGVNDIGELYLGDPSSFFEALWSLLHSAKAPKEKKVRRVEDPFQVLTAAQYYHRGREKPEWIVEGLVARGVLTTFVAAYKAGKTTLLMGLAKAVLSERDFLGRKTSRTRILYLTEENEASFKSVMRRAGLQNSSQIFVKPWNEVTKFGWGETMRRAVAYAKKLGVGVLIVDTLHRFAGLVGEEENHAGATLAATEPLQKAKAQDLAVVAVLHAGKGERSSGQLSRGSSAFGGEADIILEMRRVGFLPGDTRRKLSGTHSRFEETPSELVLEYSDGRYQLASRNESAELNERITAYLESGDGSATVPEIIRELRDEFGQQRIRKAIKELESERALVCETQEDQRGKPTLVSLVSDEAADIGLVNQPIDLPQSETGELVQ